MILFFVFGCANLPLPVLVCTSVNFHFYPSTPLSPSLRPLSTPHYTSLQLYTPLHRLTPPYTPTRSLSGLDGRYGLKPVLMKGAAANMPYVPSDPTTPVNPDNPSNQNDPVNPNNPKNPYMADNPSN